MTHKNTFHYIGRVGQNADVCEECGMGIPHPPRSFRSYQHPSKKGFFTVFCLGIAGDGINIHIETKTEDDPMVVRGFWTLDPQAYYIAQIKRLRGNVIDADSLERLKAKWLEMLTQSQIDEFNAMTEANFLKSGDVLPLSEAWHEIISGKNAVIWTPGPKDLAS